MSFFSKHCFLFYPVHLSIHILFKTWLLHWTSYLISGLHALRKDIGAIILCLQNVPFMQTSIVWVCSIFYLTIICQPIIASLPIPLLCHYRDWQSASITITTSVFLSLRSTNYGLVPVWFSISSYWFITYHHWILNFLLFYRKVSVRLLLTFFLTMSHMISLALPLASLSFICHLFPYPGRIKKPC